MIRNIIFSVLFSLLWVNVVNSTSLPDLHRPLKIPLVLSGNFGELRSNHFHSGLDFKTQGKTGYKIYCAADGYVSRVLVSPWGFGRAIYVAHPQLGLVTVYGHLLSFNDKIDKRVKAEQYKRELFAIDLTFNEGEIPVAKGEVIALSGNTGSSGGPHLHMDVRDLATGDALDPLPYFKHLLKDNVKPEVRKIALYPHGGNGAVDDTTIAAYRTTASLSKPFVAWGHVVPGIVAYDKMPGVSNIYGVKYLSLYVDDIKVYNREIYRFSFDASRAVNTLVNYPDRLKNSWVMTTHVPASQPLDSMIQTATRDGVIIIDEERDYKCRYELRDEYGNEKTIRFVIRGKRKNIPQQQNKGALFHYDGNNSYSLDGLKLNFPVGTFYDNMYFNVETAQLPEYLSSVYKIGNTGIPLHKNFDMEISLTKDTLTDKSKYCLVRIKGKRHTAIASTYQNGSIVAKTNQFGRYAVTIDNKAPSILPLNKKNWARTRKIRFRISDKLSGIDKYRGEIDGKWVLFEYDGKNALLSYELDNGHVVKGRRHRVKITVTDACGNATTRTESFVW